MPKLDLNQVCLRGFGGGIFGDKAVLKARFSAVFNAAVAEELGVKDDAYRVNGAGVTELRKFTKLALPITFENATVEMYQDLNFKPLIIDSADVKKVTVEVDDKEGSVSLLFSLSVPLDNGEMLQYLTQQKKAEAPKFKITGKQTSLFDDPESKGDDAD